jgi:hypothetical protein
MIASFHKHDPMLVSRPVGLDGLDMATALARRFLRIAGDVG